MASRRLIPEKIFEAAQDPVGWFLRAESLRDAAEIIIEREDQQLVSYLRAHDEAVKLAMSRAYAAGEVSGHAEVQVRTPNYPPAQLLYAFAIENVLKGHIVANAPQLIDATRLNRILVSHDLVVLAKRAEFTVHGQEEPVLTALSQLSVWAARYPVALNVNDFLSAPNRDELMDYGSRHPIMRVFLDRALKALEAKLPEPLENRLGAVVVFRQPGTEGL